MGFFTSDNKNNGNNGTLRQTMVSSWHWMMSYDDKIKKKQEFEKRYRGTKFVIKSDGLYRYD